MSTARYAPHVQSMSCGPSAVLCKWCPYGANTKCYPQVASFSERFAFSRCIFFVTKRQTESILDRGRGEPHNTLRPALN